MLDTIEAFIAETYVQLVATKSMCYSTSWFALLGSVLGFDSTDLALYCAVLYIAACVDVRGTVLFGPFINTTSQLLTWD